MKMAQVMECVGLDHAPVVEPFCHSVGAILRIEPNAESHGRQQQRRRTLNQLVDETY